jgi:ribonuclease J
VKSTTRIVPLGGLGEIGLNCMAVETDDSLVVVDCGVLFPDRNPGLDVIIPDFTHLRENARRVKGIVVTHGHEDHIGAIPYLLREMNVPVYGPRYALALIRERIREVHGAPEPDLRPTTVGERFHVGSVEFETLRVHHSIADATALAIRTPAGRIVHTGDFKLDDDPPDGEAPSYDRFRELGDDGVDLLLSDSTNSAIRGSSGKERDVFVALERVIAEAKQRVVVSLFASNVHRMQALIEIAKKHGRGVCLFGRSMQTHSRIAMDERYVEDFSSYLVPPEKAQEYPRDKLIVLATGSQGEPKAALSRLARGVHQSLRLDAGDMVVMSSRVIPGHEKEVAGILDDLARRGIDVRTADDSPGIHATGHACQEEQERMIELVRPRSFVPIHGGFRQLSHHARLAQNLGVDSSLVAENGQVLELSAGSLKLGGVVQSGRVCIEDGSPVADDLLEARENMGMHGLAVIVLTLDPRGKLAELPLVFAYGVLEDEAALDKAAQLIESAVVPITKRKRVDDDAELEDAARRALRRFFRSHHRRPVIECVVEWLES